MQPEGTQVRFAGQDVYIGLDVAIKSWKVCIYLAHLFHKRFAQPPSPLVLVQYLKRNFPGATYHAVYEAGYFGFWIHDALVELGVDSMVVNPADVPTSDKERRTKTDRVDAAKLARSLANGELRRLYVPDRVALEDRTLVRTRMAFVRKQTRCKNQIKALLGFYGVQVPEETPDRYWTRAYVRWLENISFTQESGTLALKALVKELLSLRETIADLTRRIHTLAQQERYDAPMKLLCTVPGIGSLAAITFLTEVISIDRFASLDRLACYVGLVPGEKSSGEVEQDTGLTPRRNAALRYMLIECAWKAQREDPALLKAFADYCTRMPKTVAVVHIARKLLSRMRYVLRNNASYVMGVLQSA
jgi:transposase